MPDLGGCVDLHVHCGPEPIPRKFDVLELDMAFDAAGMEGVAKSHFYATTPFAALAAAHGHGRVWGSLTLNRYVGGLNPDAVRGALGMHRGGTPLLRIVWMPTLHAARHLHMQRARGDRYDIPAEWTNGVVSPGSRPLEDIAPIRTDTPDVRDALLEILDLLAANDVALATGHISKEEVFALVPLAKSRGVRSIVLTHPFYRTTEMTDDELRQLTDCEGVYAEQSYALGPVDGIPLERIAASIRALGPERIVLTSDLGLADLQSPPDGLRTYLGELAAFGIDDGALRTMAAETPRRILGIG